MFSRCRFASVHIEKKANRKRPLTFQGYHSAPSASSRQRGWVERERGSSLHTAVRPSSATWLKHPFDNPPSLLHAVIEAAFRSAVEGPAVVERRLAAQVQKCRQTAAELQENALHERMPTHRQKVLQGKRLILFRHMLEAIACQDVKVVDEAAVGST